MNIFMGYKITLLLKDPVQLIEGPESQNKELMSPIFRFLHSSYLQFLIR